MTEPILSRFDILCVVRDVVDPVEVRKRAKNILNIIVSLSLPFLLPPLRMSY